MGVCDGGWAKGRMNDALPGGVQLAPVTNDNYNIIEDYSHPIVTGELTDKNPLKDGDLYSNYCSHREFIESTLPQGSKVILRAKNSNRPTLVEYPYGQGKVIASGLTWEHNYHYYESVLAPRNYGGFAVKALDDYYAYGISLINSTIGYEFRRAIGIEYEQTSQPVPGAIAPIIKRVSADFDDEKNYYTLSITDFTADNNASPFFFWKTNDGYFIDASDDYKTVRFIPDPGMKGKLAKVNAYIGDNLGYTSQYLIEVEGKMPLSEDGMNVEIISDMNNLKAEETFKIEYFALNKDGDKIIPGTSVDIFYTPDGENWIQIADGILDKNSFEWQVPAIKSDYAKIRIVAQNGIKIKSAESQVFRITPSYYVTGSVLDLKGTGVPGIKVECNGIETFTDNSGRFILRGLGIGEHVIRVSGENVLFVKSEASVYLDENNYYSDKIFRIRN
ncbi:MAG: carboxypeptidase regulatory-like domain-containing protein [Clostridiaceae bacterium]|nr:carboxypeptidase regulatory-like domain-containing protein [Clostridiaceae bacterium]